MNIGEKLLATESKLWTGGAADYREALDDNCLMAFTGMAGVSSREEVAQTVNGDAPRWRDLDIELEGLVRPTEDTAIITYRAKATRGDEGELYRALVSSGYVKRDGEWKLMFHQQTPLED